MFLKQLCLLVFLGLQSIVVSQETTESCDVSCHCIRNLTPAGVMISHVHPKNEWMLSYRYMQMGMGTPIQGRSAISELNVYTNYLGYTPSMRMDMHMVMGMVGITNRFTAMVMFNYLANSMPMNMMSGHSHHGMTMSTDAHMDMHTNGLGDTKLHALYGIVKNTTTQVVASLGVSLPTGSIQLKGLNNDMFYAGNRLPYMMQLGSGTVDALPGVTFVTQHENLTYSAQVQGIVRLNTNKVGYQFGDEINATTWLGYNWWKGFGSSLRLEGSWVGTLRGSDSSMYFYNEIASNPQNYGGVRLQGLAGLSYQFEEGFIANHRFAIEYGLPLYQKANGIQNKLNQTWMASWSYSF